MTFYKQLINKLRIYHFSTNINVCLIKNDEYIFQIPKKVYNINSILQKDDYKMFSNVQSDPFKSFYYKNDYEECYILMKITEYCIVVGPMLTEPIFEGVLNNIIINNKLSIKLKSQLSKYYDSLSLVDKNRYYYLGQLLENLVMDYTSPKMEVESSYDNDNSFLPDQYFINVLENRNSMFQHPPYFLEQELINKIKDGDNKGAISVLNEINSLKRAKLSDNHLRSIKNSIICSTTLFTRAIIEGGVDPETAFTLCDAYICSIEKTESISKLINMEYKIVESFTNAKNNLSSNQYSRPIHQALTYIHDHLVDKITLEQVANYIYVHPNYLSSLFLKEVGISFKEYINKKRIEEAKYYIRYTNTPFSDIATFFQFCNQSYFTHLFKKYTNMTPRQYRIKYMK